MNVARLCLLVRCCNEAARGRSGGGCLTQPIRLVIRPRLTTIDNGLGITVSLASAK